MELNIVSVNGNTFCVIPEVEKLKITTRTQIFNHFKVDGIVLEHSLGKPIFYEPNGWEIPGCGNGLIAYYFIQKYIKQNVKKIDGLSYIAFDIKPHSIDKISNSIITYISVNDEPHAVIQHGKMIHRPDLVQEYRQETYYNTTPNPYERDINTSLFFDAGDGIIQTQTFESGVYKQTPSCGTGSIACAYLCNKRRYIFGKRVYSKFLIRQNGGIAYIKIINGNFYYHAPAVLIQKTNCKLFKNKLYLDNNSLTKT